MVFDLLFIIGLIILAIIGILYKMFADRARKAAYRLAVRRIVDTELAEAENKKCSGTLNDLSIPEIEQTALDLLGPHLGIVQMRFDITYCCSKGKLTMTLYAKIKVKLEGVEKTERKFMDSWTIDDSLCDDCP